MKFEIQRVSADPANTLMDVYEVPSTRPSFRIYEEDLYECMTDAQINNLNNGATVFNLKKADLFIHCKRGFL